MSYKIEELEGIGPKYAEALKKIGITKTDELLKIKQKDVADVAKKINVPKKNLDKWIEIADLMRIKGVAEEYSEALNRIGIDSVKEFKHRNAANTLTKLEELNRKFPDILRKLPNIDMIKEWISEAKKLPDLDIN
ncbi:MAG: DUF4332 domain-containing protein [Candidatus Lokiarchaeota archaeon]|nr:DUF4332 domain-containing protein [Candidatus Harpocratesius repetitus]